MRRVTGKAAREARRRRAKQEGYPTSSILLFRKANGARQFMLSGQWKLPEPEESNRGLKVWLDDRRPAPEGWLAVKWPEFVIEILRCFNVAEISLDHDLGDDARGTGYTVLLWIEDQVATRRYVPPVIHIHSDNGPGIDRMRRAVARIERFVKEREEACKTEG